ncbi:hypothetical protein J6590_078739 [Homalodisca vitripennis]|nr:hypothetical protein J6590_078739 [Homalodisca vitripennis]
MPVCRKTFPSRLMSRGCVNLVLVFKKSRPPRSLLSGIATSISWGQMTWQLDMKSQHIIFKRMEPILENSSIHLKVLILRLLPRHDLPSRSTIHDTVALVNNFIHELCDRHEGTSMIDISDIH